MQELCCVFNVKIKSSLAPSNGEEVLKVPHGKKKTQTTKPKNKKNPNLLQSAYLPHCRLGESIHRTALSYCRNRAPKLFLNEKSTREHLLIQHSIRLCKNSPLLLNNRQLPVNSEQEKSLPYYHPTEGVGPGFSPLSSRFQTQKQGWGPKYKCSGPKHLPVEQ